jgi:DNA polymerase-3 subunit epsilon
LNFVAIDFETGCYKQESACSVGLVKYQNGKETGSFYSLIRPPSLYIRPDFTEIHGITVKDIKDAPVFAELWNSINTFIGDLPLAAHNAMFDMTVLHSVLDWYAIPVPPIRYFCTLALARSVWPELESHALTALAKNFDIVYNAHNALDDARTCGKLVELSAEHCGNSKNLEDLLATAGIGMEIL